MKGRGPTLSGGPHCQGPDLTLSGGLYCQGAGAHIVRGLIRGQNGKWGSTGFYGPVHLGRYWSVTSRQWSVYLQYLDRVADVKKQRIMLYKLF